MSIKRILWTDGNGLHVTIPADEGMKPGEDEAAWLARVAALSVPPGVSFRIVEATDLPSSRRWRGAWQDTGAAVGIHLGRARAIRKLELLALRELRLAVKTALLERAQ